MGHPVSTKHLIVIIGATAVGKTDISLKLAKRYQCPVLSADSRQCYKELGIATAKPTEEMQNLVQHYFIDTHSIHQPISAADFEDYAMNSLGEILKKHDHCIMTGGSGLYINAVCYGFDHIPPVPDAIRTKLENRFATDGLEPLVTQLVQLDPALAKSIDLNNPRRVVRALEVCLSTGKPFSAFMTGSKLDRPFNTTQIGIRRDRKELYNRINTRIDQMVEQGLFEEAEELYEFRYSKPLQTVGYQEIFGFMDGSYDRDEAIRLLKRNSRRYAKRQLTWFGKDPSINWFEAEDQESIIRFLERTSTSLRH